LNFFNLFYIAQHFSISSAVSTQNRTDELAAICYRLFWLGEGFGHPNLFSLGRQEPLSDIGLNVSLDATSVPIKRFQH